MASMLTACGGGGGGGSAAGTSTPTGGGSTSQESSASTSSPGGYKDTVVIGVSQSCQTPDAQMATDVGGKIITKMIHMPLIFLNTETNELQPGVAESWDQTGDCTYVFHLRQGMKFHNGEEVKASDVVYTFNRGANNAGSKSVLSQIAECKAVDDHTVELTLKNIDVDYLTKIVDPLYSILSEKACTEDPENGGSIGCGPYVLDEFVLNDYITMHKFEEYWDAENLKTNNFKFRYIPENSARLIALQNGEIDVCMNPATVETAYIADDANLVLNQMNGSRVSYLSFNMNSEIGQNEKLRQAIACAVNKDDIITVAAEGAGTPAKTFWSTTLLGFYDGFEGFSYDPDKAKQLLAEAGYPDGLTIEIGCNTSTTTAVQVVQSQLKQIGIDLKINEMDAAGLTNYINQGSHTMLYNGRSYGATVEGPRKVFVTGLASNDALYSNERVDELFAEAGKITDVAQREAMYKEVQEILAEEVPYIPLYYNVIYWGTNKNFDGVMTQSGGIFYYAYSYVTE